MRNRFLLPGLLVVAVVITAVFFVMGMYAAPNNEAPSETRQSHANTEGESNAKVPESTRATPTSAYAGHDAGHEDPGSTSSGVAAQIDATQYSAHLNVALDVARITGVTKESVLVCIKTDADARRLRDEVIRAEKKIRDTHVAMVKVGRSVRQELGPQGRYQKIVMPASADGGFSAKKPNPEFDGQHVSAEHYYSPDDGTMVTRFVRINPGDSPRFDEARARHLLAKDQCVHGLKAILREICN